jgi:hypothetical protein
MRRHLLTLSVVALLALALAACGGTPTPTPTPACVLECAGTWVGMGPSLDIKITCESGESTQSMSSWQTVEEGRGLVTHFEGTRTYENTGNEYKIVANASPYQDKDGSLKVKYHVEVTGGIFAETPQTCASD